LPYHNGAAIQTNILKAQEKHHIDNMPVCRYFANPRNRWPTIVLPFTGQRSLVRKYRFVLDPPKIPQRIDVNHEAMRYFKFYAGSQ
jgi:hypothetical protein